MGTFRLRAREGLEATGFPPWGQTLLDAVDTVGTATVGYCGVVGTDPVGSGDSTCENCLLARKNAIYPRFGSWMTRIAA